MLVRKWNLKALPIKDLSKYRIRIQDYILYKMCNLWVQFISVHIKMNITSISMLLFD